jgi:multiple sugar transport system substrate-binding protein
MRKMVFVVFFALIVMVSVISVAAAPKTTITFARWAGTQEAKDFTALLNKFMAQNPDIKVETEFVPWDAYWNKLRTTVIAGTAADVIAFSNLQSGPYICKQAVYDMTKLPGAKQLLADMQEGTRDAVVVNNKIFGMPAGVGVRALIYNKDLFDKAGISYPSSTKPMTWDEFLKMAPKLTKKDKNGKVIQYAANFHKREIWEAFVVQNGGRFVDNYTHPRKMLINSPDGIGGLQFLRTLVEKEIIPPWEDQWEGAFGSPDSALCTGKVAMMQAGPWCLSPLKDLDINYGTAPLIMNKKRASRGYVNFFSISRNSKNPAAAWKLIQWMAGKGQVEFTKTGDLPANKKYLAEAQKQNPYKYPPEIMAPFFSELPYIITGPIVPTSDFVTMYEQNIKDLTALQVSAPECARRMEEQGKEIIANLEY